MLRGEGEEAMENPDAIKAQVITQIAV